MPTILRIGKYRFFFFSNEGNEPPHIHVESAENYAKFWLKPVTLEKSVGYDSHELSELRKIVEKYKNFFGRKWNAYFNKIS